jgi:hypothetical protein
MAQENDHIRKLITARDREVEQRRNVADALAQASERGETERMREAFINLQNTHPSREDIGGRGLIRPIQQSRQLKDQNQRLCLVAPNSLKF